MRLKIISKDLFYHVFPPRVSQHLLPHLPGRSPFSEGIVTRRAIFVHVPKAAGTSVKRAIYQNMASGGHRRIAEYYGYNPQLAREYFKFGFVRNPWDRMLSAYSYLKQKQGTTYRDRVFSEAVLGGKKDFTEFVCSLEDRRYRRAVLYYDHFQAQRYWVCLPGQKDHALDFLGRFENMEEDLVDIRQRLCLGETELQRIRSSVHPDYRDCYTSRTRRIVEEIYFEDIRTFGYEF